ncbi:hypothetical protein [Aquimarina amphilecti]|uniref:hypothetical protein n=1 Tax=Aquimarina amphilecti TaxID=1038014 RepID=UPI000B8831DE|nr:hypothetical protein [Aquimarina amphilecti]
MKKALLIICYLISIGCARNVEPSVENVNKIFASQDFTFEFNEFGSIKKSISFRDDYLVYKSDQPTLRREITYDEVLLINDFIQEIVDSHQKGLDIESSSYYVLKNTAYKTVIISEQEDFYFEALLKTLKLIE